MKVKSEKITEHNTTTSKDACKFSFFKDGDEGMRREMLSCAPQQHSADLIASATVNLHVQVHVYLYDRCVGVQRHHHGLHIPCSTVKT